LLPPIHLSVRDARPTAVVVSLDGRRAYVLAAAGAGDSVIAALDTASGQTLASASIKFHASRIAISPDGNTLFTAHATDAGLSVIDANTLKSIQTINIGSPPFAIAIGAHLG